MDILYGNAPPHRDQIQKASQFRRPPRHERRERIEVLTRYRYRLPNLEGTLDRLLPMMPCDLEDLTMPTKEQLYDEAEKLKDAGQLAEAAAKLQKLAAAEPDYALAHSGLAVVLQRLGQHESAIEHARKVCELQPNDAFSFTALSVTLQRAYAGTGELSYIQMAEEAMARAQMIQQMGR